MQEGGVRSLAKQQLLEQQPWDAGGGCNGVTGGGARPRITHTSSGVT